MLKIFDEFRERLDQVMVKAFGHRVVLWGYGYTGRFLEWYAEYYHSIKMDFIITEDWTAGQPYNFPLFRDSLFDFDYMDVKDAIIWLAIPEGDDVKRKMGGGGTLREKPISISWKLFMGIIWFAEKQMKKIFFKRERLVYATYNLWSGWNMYMVAIL